MYDGIFWVSSCFHSFLSALLSMSRGFSPLYFAWYILYCPLYLKGSFMYFECCLLDSRESLFRMLLRVWLALDRCESMDSLHHMMRQLFWWVLFVAGLMYHSPWLGSPDGLPFPCDPMMRLKCINALWFIMNKKDRFFLLEKNACDFNFNFVNKC